MAPKTANPATGGDRGALKIDLAGELINCEINPHPVHDQALDRAAMRLARRLSIPISVIAAHAAAAGLGASQ